MGDARMLTQWSNFMFSELLIKAQEYNDYIVLVEPRFGKLIKGYS